jgi:N-hydroxyarylamine O-acetyltransferase
VSNPQHELFDAEIARLVGSDTTTPRPSAVLGGHRRLHHRRHVRVDRVDGDVDVHAAGVRRPIRRVSPVDQNTVERYLDRLGVTRSAITIDAVGLERLQFAHLHAIPFENLDIVFGEGIDHDRAKAFNKIVRQGRGGWCFELNGACAMLLEALGFRVSLLGAAVLTGGPNSTIDHLALEVSTSEGTAPRLVDVGFGASFVRPLPLNVSGPLDGGDGPYEMIASPQGTTLTRHVDGVPEALYRFKRVAHRFDDFAGIARSLQDDPSLHWSAKPVVTRLLDAEGTRVTLTRDRLSVSGPTPMERTVDRTDWDHALAEWFSMQRPGPWPDDT